MVAPSVANFLLVRFPEEPGRDAKAAHAHLLRSGISVRPVGGYGLGHSLRITIGLEDEMAAVVAALTAFVKGSSAATAA